MLHLDPITAPRQIALAKARSNSLVGYPKLAFSSVVFMRVSGPDNQARSAKRIPKLDAEGLVLSWGKFVVDTWPRHSAALHRSLP